MKRLFASLATVAAAALTGAVPANASAAPEHFAFTEPVAGETFADGCTGQLLTVVSGDFHVVVTAVTNGNGGFTIAPEGNAEGVTAVDETGTVYQLTGGFWGTDHFNIPPGGAVVTDVDVLNEISHGAKLNSVAVETVHFTVTPDGNVTAAFDHLAGGCKGS